MDEPTDKLCIIRCLEGETEFYGILVRRYQNHLFNIVNKTVRDSATAEDVVQEAFLRAYKSLKNFDIDRDFFPYLVRIATNCLKDYLKKHSLNLSSEVDQEITPEEPIDYTELYEAIYSLPDDFKEIIILYYIKGKPIREIATIVGRTPENVKVQLFRARKMLFDKLN
ncbi:MAG: RNA polymerase sigma factor [Caldisericaceae bacterium]